MKSDSAKAAALLRAEIKKAFPGLKFTCKSSNYSMGSSINVDYTDATKEQHEAIKAMSHKYQYGHFDGMTDMYEYSNVLEIPQAKYVSCSNHMSDKTREDIYQKIRVEWHGGDQLPASYEEGRNVRFYDGWVSQFVWRQFCEGVR